MASELLTTDELSARSLPCFREFIQQWTDEQAIEWRRSHLRTLRSTIDGHLIPSFGDQPIDRITWEGVLAFRNALAARSGRKPGSRLSSKRINSIVALLTQVLDAAAKRYQFDSPALGIKR